MYAKWVEEDQKWAFGVVKGDGAISISKSEKAALMLEQEDGKILVKADDGRPAAIPYEVWLSIQQPQDTPNE